MDVRILKIRYTHNGIDQVIYPALITSNSQSFLVDCGYEGFSTKIEKALNDMGLSFDQITGVIVTHHDIDHIGALYEIKEKYPSIKIFSSIDEEPYINGTKKSLRLQQAELLYDSLPEDQKLFAIYFQEQIKNIRSVSVDESFFQDRELPFLTGVWSVHTAGHMPYHISLYVKEKKTLIASDAFVIQGDEFEMANPQFTMNMELAIQSLEKLITYDIETVICYHGGMMEHQVKQKMEKLIEKYKQEK